MNLCALSVGEPQAFVSGLDQPLKACGSVEESCALLCSALYEQCRAPGGGASLVLSRVYLALPFSALDSGGARFVRENFGVDPAPSDLFLALLGTRGDAPEWCDRKLSRGHRAIPLNRHTATTVPMLARCFQQIGFDLDTILQAEEGIHLEGLSRSFGVFHVEDALGSPYVPAQDEFVKPYGVKSVVGSGTMLPNGAISIWIGFARQPIERGSALPLVPMMPAFWQLVHPLYRRRSIFAD
ncbi:MAG: hypothetical protein HY319_05860 [Armatimonadetes bacterium]|nr:hypothetical protein [Armatimonadota bacterium]